MTEWQPFNYCEPPTGLCWLEVERPETWCDAGDDGRTIGGYTGAIQRLVVLAEVYPGDDGMAAFEGAGYGDLGKVEDGDAVRRFMLLTPPTANDFQVPASKARSDPPPQDAADAWRQEIKAIIVDADVGPPTDAGICVECGRWTPWHHREAHDHRDWCSAPKRYAARRDWKGRLQALIAPQSKGPEDCSPGPGGAITHPTPDQPKT